MEKRRQKMSLYEKLSKVNVNENKKKKGQYD